VPDLLSAPQPQGRDSRGHKGELVKPAATISKGLFLMMTDTIADMLTRIRNANQRKHELVEMPASKLRVEIAKILKREGFVNSFKVVQDKPVSRLQIHLRYIMEDQVVINGLRKVSRPGRRYYVGKDEIPSVRGGMGIAILSTSKGIMTDRESRKENVGGEVLCYVW
jgi:small subunit ribosomal protein S8